MLCENNEILFRSVISDNDQRKCAQLFQVSLNIFSKDNAIWKLPEVIIAMLIDLWVNWMDIVYRTFFKEENKRANYTQR